MDLRHVKGMFAKAQNEAIEASEKLSDLHQQRLDETVKLKHMSFKEEAIELAEKLKAEYKATKREEAKYAEEFSWEEITLATLSFSNDVRIGMGSYGTVYKCTLRHMNVAVKILHSMEANRIEQFHREIEILSKIRHPNLVTLLGACPDRGCLIYEYMENGSLDDRLFRKNNTPPIPWFERYKIAQEIASALLFLHNSKPKPIIHRDLKPSNILLDQNYVTKIGDVGLSAMLHSDMYNTTISYTDPEYQRTGVVSTKSDVYAFGMVVLQLLTAKPAIALASLMETAIGDDRLARVLDVEAGDWPIEETMELAVLALKCTELRGRDRPDLINEIVPALEKLRMVSDKQRDLASFGQTSPPTHFICPIQKVRMDSW
ncbi:hypothetical protein ACJIZ3_022462 [Penstemon smallii]|uniref:Protein kinase domain-containing protein n=1 Tax=Penstemon smallii TaxID=265156 RepID=A0ABD3TML9_9LAMI